MTQEKDTANDLGGRIAKLTATERTCLERVRAGKKSKEIAREMKLKPYSVDSAIRDACAKLGTNSRFLAARMIADTDLGHVRPDAEYPDPNFGSQNTLLPPPDFLPNKEASEGEGYGPDDPEQTRMNRSGFHDSGDGIAWIGKSYPFAKYFWGDNQLSKRRRLFLLVARAAIVAIAVGGIVNGLIGLSKLLQPR